MGKWALVLVLVAAVLVGWLAYSRFSDSVPVLGAAVRTGEIREFIDERGKTRLPQTYLITMPDTARIEAIDLIEGTAVRKGQVVARVVPSDLQLSVDAATAAVQRLDAAIKENDDKSVELTGLQQAIQFVESMDRTVDAAEARVLAGEEKKDFAERQFGRTKQLADRDAASQEELERADLARVQTRLDLRQDQLVKSAMVAMQMATKLAPTMVRQYIDRKLLSRDVLAKQRLEAEARLAQVQQDQRRGTLASPVDGVVLSRRVSDERYISAGTVLLEIGRLEDLEIEADVLSQDVVNVKPGDEVDIYGPAIGQAAAKGVVTRIFPAGFTKVSSLGVEQQRVKVVMKMTDDDLRRLLGERNLGVDYRVRVRIYTAQKPHALVIPRSSLFRGGDGKWQVFAVRDGRARLTPIDVGLMNDEHVEATSGLRDGDIVVLAPEMGLENGQRVEVNVRE